MASSGRPSTPQAASARSRPAADPNRCWNTVANHGPPGRARSASRSSSRRLSVGGFSASTDAPAARHCPACSKCRAGGVHRWTRSGRAAASSPARSACSSGTPCPAPNAASRARSMSAAPTSSAPGSPRSAAAWTPAMFPVPAIAMRTGAAPPACTPGPACPSPGCAGRTGCLHSRTLRAAGYPGNKFRKTFCSAFFAPPGPATSPFPLLLPPSPSLQSAARPRRGQPVAAGWPTGSVTSRAACQPATNSSPVMTSRQLTGTVQPPVAVCRNPTASGPVVATR